LGARVGGAKQKRSENAAPDDMGKHEYGKGKEAMTNQRWLEISTQFLMENGHLTRSQAHLQARLLLDGATGTRFSHLTAPQTSLEPPTQEKLQDWLADAARGRPIPYILGKAPFWGRKWAVDERVLIPRPETELLVETSLEMLSGAGAKVADLGTGSGIIALSLKLERPDLEVVAVDISEGALEIARRNAELHGVQVHFVRGQSDWLAPLKLFAPFDAIVSNPPYIAAAEIGRLEIGVRDFEPKLALDGGKDGLDPYRAIAQDAASMLRFDGFVAVELGAGQFERIRAIFLENGWKVEAARRDLAGIERVLVARLSR